MQIPFTKAHGARNDFLLTWEDQAPASAEAAIAICDRHTGIGADGWLLVSRLDKSKADHDVRIRLFNSDGGEVEMSGNGTRCAAAFAISNGFSGDSLRIATGGGVKHLQLLERKDHWFNFEMNMGKPVMQELRCPLPVADGMVDCTILNVGNPQCAVFVEDFNFDWRAMGSAIERHPTFPKRTNVSFVRPVDGLNIEVRFFERGAGETMSSGTGSTGAAIAAILRGFTGRSLTVMTPAGPLDFNWPDNESDVMMVGPAQLIGSGTFWMD